MLVSNILIVCFAVVGAVSSGYWTTRVVAYFTKTQTAEQKEIEMLRDRVEILQSEFNETTSELRDLRKSTLQTQETLIKGLLTE